MTTLLRLVAVVISSELQRAIKRSLAIVVSLDEVDDGRREQDTGDECHWLLPLISIL